MGKGKRGEGRDADDYKTTKDEATMVHHRR